MVVDRTLTGGILRQLTVFVLLILFVLFSFWILCQIFGIPLTRSDSGNDFGALWNLIYFFTDEGSQTSAVEGNRFVAFIISILGSVLLGGVLISTLSNIFERRVENAENGLVRYRLSNHVIIIGHNSSTAGLIMQLCNDPQYEECDILVQTSLNVNDVRMLLKAELSSEANKRVVLYFARRDSFEEVLLLHPLKARELFIVNEQTDDCSDSKSMDCIRLVARACKKRPDKLKCTVVFQNHSTVAAFQRADLDSDIKDSIEFYPLIFHEIIASNVLVDNRINNKIIFPPLDREALTEDSDSFVHLVISGMSDMGIAMGIQAAHIEHFPNFRRQKTKITFIDSDAGKKMEWLMARYQSLFDVADSHFLDTEVMSDFRTNEKNSEYEYLGDFTDIEFYFVEGTTELPVVRSLIERWTNDKNSILTIAICNENSDNAISEGMFLPSVIYESHIPVFVYQKESASILQSLGSAPSTTNKAMVNQYSGIHPFGMAESIFSFGSRSLKWAQIINFIYSFYFENGVLPDSLPSEREWLDRWMPAWHSLMIIKQWSNIYHANSIPVKLRSIGYDAGVNNCNQAITDDQVEILAKVEHNRWIMEELILGYRPATHGERVKVIADISMKKELRNRFVHVDICGFDDLLTDERGNHVSDYDRILVKSIPLIIKDI